IFENKDPAFPLEPQLEAELKNYKVQQRLAERDKGRFKDAESALSDALKDIKKVIRLLDTVINYVPFEIFGGPIIDEEQVAYLEASKRRLWEVQRMLNVARTILPEIPYPQSLDVVTNNGLLNMRFDMEYVDMNWKVKTSQCFGLLATTYRNIQNAMTWVKQYREYTEGAVERLGVVIDSTRNALHNERERIINVVLSGHTTDGQSGSGAQPTSDEPPPPVYEAPHEQENDQHLNLPDIPTNLTPASSVVSLPMEAGHSPLLSAVTPSHNPNAPPQPITPILDLPAIHISSNDDAPAYVSTNTNNPFTRH
ncbi:hypothetical protein K501DRAFT_170616, partial [Backusella circina FSU 941]